LKQNGIEIIKIGNVGVNDGVRAIDVGLLAPTA
jgi:hypothetical protein